MIKYFLMSPIEFLFKNQTESWRAAVGGEVK